MAILTLDQARAFAQAAGFSGPSLSIVLAIAQAESGLNTQATNGPGDNTPPSIDRGVLQLNSFWHAEVPDACAFDPACAFTAAWTISGGGAHWPWSTYSNGAYLKYMPPAGAPPMADTITGGVVKRETEFIETQPGNPN
ncbi:MAG TPA: hypothetical protein VMV29_04390, partial [Ktedonobacterales bacterium]|nr:hypothetical protein [Ktedonobacterales bacterium]